MELNEAKIEWSNNCPRSKDYGDIYYSIENGLEESRYVFIENNQLAERWEELLESQKSSYTIMETGFGTGLNFLTTWQAWESFLHQQDTRRAKELQLHFISFENQPLEKTDITRALNNFPILKKYSERLLAEYPIALPGSYRLSFDNVHLTIIFGDAETELKKIRTPVNSWFLDGFAPSLNESLWSENLLNEVARLSVNGTSFATFTCAGRIRRHLEVLGFECEKVKGFGNKREMLVGKFSTSKPNENSLQNVKEPWFLFSPTLSKQDKTVIIIGAGLAGCWTAYHLAKRQWEVVVIEKGNEIADAASGNPRAALFYKLPINQDKQNQFNLSSFLFAQQKLNTFKLEKDTWIQCGLKQYAYNGEEENKLERYKSSSYEKSGLISVNQDHIHLPMSGSADPRQLCNYLLSTSENITLLKNAEVKNLSFDKSTTRWHAHTKQGMKSSENNTISATFAVICNSYSAQTFGQTSSFPLHAVRGQATFVKSTKESKKIKSIYCTNGYITPTHTIQSENNETQECHTIGATFDPRSRDSSTLESDNVDNLKHLKKNSPEVFSLLCEDEEDEPKVIGARASVRCQSPDYLPLIGPVPDRDYFLEAYQGLRKGQRNKIYPEARHLQNLFINVAHGSRGLTTTPLAGEIIACQINDEPALINSEIEALISPARFYIRELVKNK